MKKQDPAETLRWIGIWTVGALTMTMILTGLVGWLVMREIIPYENAWMLVSILSAVCLFAACYMAVKTLPNRRLIYAVIMAGIYVGVGLLVRAAIGNVDGFEADVRLVLPAAAAVAAGLLASRAPARRRK